MQVEVKTRLKPQGCFRLSGCSSGEAAYGGDV